MQLDLELGFLSAILPKYLNTELDTAELSIGKVGGQEIVYNYTKIPAFHGMEAAGIFEELSENKKGVAMNIKEVQQKLASAEKQRAFELLLMQKKETKGKITYTPLIPVDEVETTFTLGLLKKLNIEQYDLLKVAQGDFFYKQGILSEHLLKLLKKFTNGKTVEQLVSEIKNLTQLTGLINFDDTELKETLAQYEATPNSDKA